MVRDHARAEDITQDVFISALRRMRDTERPIAFKPWIYEIAKNACIDAFRRSKRAEEVSFDAEDDLASGERRRMASATHTPDAAFEEKNSMARLQGAFGGLSETHHQILVMRELEGRSYAEIGERLGMSRPAVESTLFRARKRLSEEYEELVTGERCQRVQAIVAAASGGPVGLRDERQMARHISYCQPCRRCAIDAGFDVLALSHKPVRSRIAAILPLPAFLKRRWGGRDDAGATGVTAAATLAPYAAAASSYADPALAGWVKTAVAVAAVAVAGAGAGVAVDRSGTLAGIEPDRSRGGEVASADGTDDGAGAGVLGVSGSGGGFGGLPGAPAAGGAGSGPGDPGAGSGGSGGSGGGAGGSGGSGGGPGLGGLSSGTSIPALRRIAGGALGGATTTTGNAVAGVGGSVNGTVGGVGGTVTKTVGGVGGTVKNTGGGTVGGAGGTVKDTVGGAGGTVKDTVGGAGGTVKDTVGGAGGTVKDTVGGAGGTVKDTVGGVPGTVKDTVGGAPKALPAPPLPAVPAPKVAPPPAPKVALPPAPKAEPPPPPALPAPKIAPPPPPPAPKAALPPPPPPPRLPAPPPPPAPRVTPPPAPSVPRPVADAVPPAPSLPTGPLP